MNTMKLIAMPALAALVLAACGGGGGLAPAMPDTEAVVPVVVAEPEGDAEHNRLVLPGFAAPDVDEAMFRLAHETYRAPSANQAAGGGGLAAASLALQAGAYALYAAERSAEYRANHAFFHADAMEIPELERALARKLGQPLNPEIPPGVLLRGQFPGGWRECHLVDCSLRDAVICDNARGECSFASYPPPGETKTSPAVCENPKRNCGTQLNLPSPLQHVFSPIEDMPYLTRISHQ